MFRTKYFVISLVIHFVLICLFIISKNMSEKAETTMLVVEIININKASEFKHKKTSNSQTKIIDKVNLKLKNSEDEQVPIKVILKPEGITEIFKSSKLNYEKKNNDAEKTLVKNEKPEKMNSPRTNLMDDESSQNANLFKATYKIGSIKNPHPPYPIIARKKGLQGKLVLKVSINNDGSVKNVVVGKSSGHKILDNVSKETVEKWVFVPAKKMGEAVEDNIKVPIRFILTE